jgi:outer membrane protein assembly factor BamB
MNRWQKLSILLIAIFTLSVIASLSQLALAAEINPTYTETNNNGDQLDIKFSERNDSIVYIANQNYVNFSVGLGRYTFDYMSLGTFIYSISYRASWLSGEVTVYSWSYNDPANLKDDDPDSRTSFQGTISLSNAPIGTHQITVTALAGCYATDFNTYWIYTADTQQTLNLTIVSYQPQTPNPTFASDSGIKWRTNIGWNLVGTPAENVWSSNIQGKYREWTTPVVTNGVLYVGATSSVALNYYGTPRINWINIYAFDAQNGKQIWDHQAIYSSTTELAVADGRVYFGAQTDFYYVEGDVKAVESVNALDAATGELLWSTPCAISYSTPVTENGKVFINSGNSMLGLDGDNGRVLWNYTTNGFIVSAPTVGNGVLCVSSYDNAFYALNTFDGSKIWSIKTDNGFSGCKAVGDVVYVASGDGKMNAFTAATGNKLWSQNIAPPEFAWVNRSTCTTPAYYSGALYFTGWSEQSLEQAHVGVRGISYRYYKTYLYALNLEDHSRIWNLTFNNFQFNDPVQFSEGMVYTNDYQRILGFNAQNGALIWNYTNSDLWPSSQPTVTDGFIYIGFSDGQIYAISAPEIGFNGGNQGMNLFNGYNGILFVIILVNIAITVTVLIMYRNKKSDRKKQL